MVADSSQHTRSLFGYIGHSTNMSVGQAVRKRKADQAVDSGEQELLELLSQTGWPLADESRGWENDIPRRSLQ